MRREAREGSARYFCQVAITAGERRNLRGAFRAMNAAYAIKPNGPEIIETAINVLQFDAGLQWAEAPPAPLLKFQHPEWSHYDQLTETLWRRVVDANKRSPSTRP
jgi:hypothetical protein